MWLAIEPLAMLKRMCPPPAPRSLAGVSGRVVAAGPQVAGRNLQDVAVVGGARRLVIDEHGLGAVAPPRPRLQLDGAQVGHVLRADDVEALAAHESQVRRVFLGPEFLSQIR